MQDPYYSFGKLIDYVRHTAIDDMTVDMGNGKVEEYKAPSKFLLSPMYFRGDSCWRSGRCCRPYDVSWTKADYDRQYEQMKDQGGDPTQLEGFSELQETGLDYEIQVNGTTVPLFIDPMTNKEKQKKTQCDQLRYGDDGNSYCAIRDINSITCRMPHSTIRYYADRDATYFQKQQFGRNHQLQCPVRWMGFSMEGLLETDIPLLQRLNQTGEDMGVRTIIPNLLKLIDLMMPKLGEGYLPLEPIEIPLDGDKIDQAFVDEKVKWGKEGQEPQGFRAEPNYNAVFIPTPKVRENS